MAKDKRPIIIIKKVKKVHGAHHGGSWKVAYADFVTAMMAFFMVLWILGMDETTRKDIETYFQNPVGIHKDGYSAGTSPISTGASPAAVSTQPVQLVTRSLETQQFRELGDRIRASLEGPDGLGAIAAQVEIVVTEEGLRIELIEGEDGELFFAFGSAVLKPAAARALRVIAAELTTTSSPIVVEGHTDAARFGSAGYSNWELSADRANAARRTMEGSSLGQGRIREIRGHADQHLRVPEAPLDNANRRTSILLPFTSGSAPPVLEAAALSPAA